MISTIVLYHMLILTPYRQPLPSAIVAIDSIRNYEFPSPGYRFVAESVAHYKLAVYSIERMKKASETLATLAKTHRDQDIDTTKTDITTIREKILSALVKATTAVERESATKVFESILDSNPSALINNVAVAADVDQLIKLRARKDSLVGTDQAYSTLDKRIASAIANLYADVSKMSSYGVYILTKKDMFASLPASTASKQDVINGCKAVYAAWNKFLVFKQPQFTAIVRSFDGNKLYLRTEAINLLQEATVTGQLTEDMHKYLNSRTDVQLYNFVIAGAID